MIKKIIILGSGAGGTIIANKLRKNLPESDWQITIIDHDENHHYQPGWLFIPFGIYSPSDCIKPKRDFIPPGVDFKLDEVTRIDPEERRVITKLGSYDYDWLIVATGCRIAPEEVEGMMDDWMGDIHTFYSLEGAIALRNKLKYFESGRLVLNVCELPYKCPVAPIEFIFMADSFLTVAGLRDKVELEIVTPLPGIFTKPVATKMLTALAQQKNIKVTPNFDIAQVNTKEKTIESHRGMKIPYDLLVTIPPNLGSK
jgi:sulfide:quinone oxidoreductase